MNLQQRFNKIIQQNNWWHQDEKVLVAVSTGVDSMSLLTLLQNLPQHWRPQINVAYVDHHLRDASRQETIFINEYCQQHHLLLWQADWLPTQHPHYGIEAAARRFRYQFFKQVMAQQQINNLLTAHHGDDQLETLLMQLVRSGNIVQMRGILPKQAFGNGYLERPLLTFSKTALRDFADERHLTYFEDVTNYEDDVLRNRLRHHVIPFLKTENEHVLQHAQQFSEELTALLDFADTQLLALIAQATITSDAQQWQGDWQTLQDLKPMLQRRTLQLIWRELNQHETLSLALLDEMIALLDNKYKPNGMLYLPHGWYLQKHYHELTISRQKATSLPKTTWLLTLNKTYHLSDKTTLCLTDKVTRAGWPLYGIDLQNCQLQLRHWQSGDFLILPSNHQQKLNRFFIDHHLSQQQRNTAWVVVNEKQRVLWMLVAGQVHNFTANLKKEPVKLVIILKNVFN